MKHVTFAQSAGEFRAGDKRVVPDEVAARFPKEAVLSVETWPAPRLAAQKPRRAVLNVKRVGAPDLLSEI